MNTDALLLLAIDLFLKSAIVVVFAWLILRMWTQASAAQRGCIWGIVFAVMVVLPVARLIMPHWALSLPGASVANTTSGQSVPVAPRESSVAGPGDFVGTSPVARTWVTLDGTMAIISVWAIGAILSLAYRLTGTFLLHHYYRASSPLQGRDGEVLAGSLATACGISRPVDIRLSEDCHVPVTWGTWRPVVMLPAEALNWPRGWQESALRHELSHVKNFDHLKRWIAFLACAFYWPNPLVWVAARQFQLAQEEASDNLVLGAGVLPQNYATQLLEVIQTAAGRRVLSLPVVAMARRSTLEGRLSAILDETRNRESSSRKLVLVGSGSAIILGVVLGAIQLRADDSSPQNGSSLPAAQANQEFTDAVNALVIPGIDLKQVNVRYTVAELEQACKKANPHGLPLRFMIQGPAPAKFDLHVESGSLQNALDAIGKQANLQYKIGPLYVYYMDDVGAPLRPKLEKIICTFWPAGTEDRWGRTLAISDGAMHVLHLQPGPTGDVRESLEKWGIQFPPGTIANCKPFKERPGQNMLEIEDTGDQVAQVLNLLIAASPEDWTPKKPAETKAAAPTSAPATQNKIFKEHA